LRRAAEVGPPGNAGHAFEVVSAIAMHVAAKHRLDVVTLEQIERDGPVVYPIINRVMGNENNGLFGVVHGFHSRFQPAQILRRPMTISNFHDWPLVHPDESVAFGLKVKTVRAPDPWEIGRAGFAPFGVVIAGDDVAGDS